MPATDPASPFEADPFLRAIRDEARRLPAGVLISAGHVAGVLGAPSGSTELVDRLASACDGLGLDAAPEEPDGIRFTRRPPPAASPRKPRPPAAD